MPILLSLAAAVFPMLMYLLIIWKMDKYEPEPLKYVLQHFLWGAFGAIIFGIIGSEIVSSQMSEIIFDDYQFSLLQTVLVAPFVEEITKGFYLLFTVNSKKFDNLTDGLVYGGAIGLGFGMTENFLYFISYGDTLEAWIYLVVIRSGFSAVMHCMSTATLGAFFSRGKYSVNGKVFYPLLGLFSAMFIHFLWNFSVSFENTFMYGFLMIIVIVVIFFIVYRISLKHEQNIITEELSEEKDLFPLSYVPILASPARFKRGWIEEDIRKTFSNAATTLAFRKREFKRIKDSRKESYAKDIMSIRHYISTLIKHENEYEEETT